MSVVVVKPGDDARLGAALSLFNGYLGEQIYSPERLAEVTRDTEALLTTWDEGGVQGAAVSRLLYPEDAGYYTAFGPAATELFRGRRVGSLEALAVEVDRRHHRLEDVGQDVHRHVAVEVHAPAQEYELAQTQVLAQYAAGVE